MDHCVAIGANNRQILQCDLSSFLGSVAELFLMMDVSVSSSDFAILIIKFKSTAGDFTNQTTIIKLHSLINF